MRDEDLRGRFRRDFTKEVIGQQSKNSSAPTKAPEIPKNETEELPTAEFSLPSPEITPAAERQKTKSRRRGSGKRIVFVLVILALLAGVAYGGHWYWAAKIRLPIPASIRSAADYPLLYPSKLPDGYKINEGSFSTANGVVIFNATNSSSDKIAFTDQKKPSNFDFDTFYKQSLANSTIFTTTLGQAAIGTANNQLLGSLTTDQSWLLVTATSKDIKSPDLRTIIENIKVAPAPKHP